MIFVHYTLYYTFGIKVINLSLEMFRRNKIFFKKKKVKKTRQRNNSIERPNYIQM